MEDNMLSKSFETRLAFVMVNSRSYMFHVNIFSISFTAEMSEASFLSSQTLRNKGKIIDISL